MDSLFFWFSKLAWLFISPDSLLLFCFALGLFLLWKKRFYGAKKIFTSLFIILLFIGFLPVGEWLLYPLEKRHPVNPTLENVDGIIMLGGTEEVLLSHFWQQNVLGGSAERYFAFIQLAKKHPNAKMLFTGGGGSMTEQDYNYKEADVAKQVFKQQGLNTSKILFERESRNTWENALFSKKRVQPKEGENWVLITTAWHMPRSVGIFCQVNWKVTPYPVDFTTHPNHLLRLSWSFPKHLGNLKTGIKEWIGIIAYQLTGKMCKG